MKTLALALFILCMSMSGTALAQSNEHASTETAAPSDAQAAFDKLKTLAGSWVGTLTTDPVEPAVVGKLGRLSLRETSLGNAIVHELSLSGRPDHPVTMFYLEEDELRLTHYCDSGNRPRMVGKVSEDGKTVQFDFLDLTGDNKYGHMHSAVFTLVDEDHHIEEWTWMRPDNQPVRVRFDLQRTGSLASGL